MKKNLSYLLIVLFSVLLAACGGSPALSEGTAQPTAAPAATDTGATSSPLPTPTPAPTMRPTATETAVATRINPTSTAAATFTATPPAAAELPTDEVELRRMAEAAWGEALDWPVQPYSAHEGEEGFPNVCAGLCYDTSKVAKTGVMKWYGPSHGEEDLTQSPMKFGNGTKGPLDLMRDGNARTVIFPLSLDSAQFEACAIPGSTLDGVPLTQVLRHPSGDFVKEGECGRGVILKGWHTVRGSHSSEVAGFGVRLAGNQWARLDEAAIVAFTSFWDITGTTATWNPTQTAITNARADGVDTNQIQMTPSMVSMMQNFRTLDTVKFTTTVTGTVLFCNGQLVNASGKVWSTDGGCRAYEVPKGSYTYTAPRGDRTASGVSWNPKP